MKLEEIKEILKEFQKQNWKRVRLKQGDFEIDIEQESTAPAQAAPQQSPATKVEQPKSETRSSTSSETGTYITSPMVGTFYSSPSPDQPPFVKVGDTVEANSVVCIIEAMKVMNEVKAGKTGVIAEIMADNSQPVEFGTKLFRIE